jgi:radical SAM superfamily enzyme YgiQ (UPF0313 family)
MASEFVGLRLGFQEVANLMKVILLEPRSDFNAYSRFVFPLLGPLYLGTILKDKGHQVKVFSEGVVGDVMRGKENILRPELLQADVVGISAMTTTANRGYSIADAIRRARPKTRIIFGGPHASMMYAEALEYGDAVVVGEAEDVITDVVEDPSRTGVVLGSAVEDLNSLPFPDFDLMDGLDRALTYVPISTSRGCPYDCTFCSVTKMFGRKYRFRDPENILEEIRLRSKAGFDRFFFYDDNFAAHLGRTKKLLKGIQQESLIRKWTAQTRADIARNDELLHLMSGANCHAVLIGLESINPKTLDAYCKRQTVDDIKECISAVHHHGVNVHGMFVLGSDDDDMDTIHETVRFCRDARVDTAQFSTLFPIPGTPLYDRLEKEDRIFTKNWSLYDGAHVVFYPSKMTPLELMLGVRSAWSEFYSFNLRKLRTFLASRYLLMKWKASNRDYLDMLKRLPEQALLRSRMVLGRT